jgi:hypothetical protein
MRPNHQHKPQVYHRSIEAAQAVEFISFVLKVVINHVHMNGQHAPPTVQFASLPFPTAEPDRDRYYLVSYAQRARFV